MYCYIYDSFLNHKKYEKQLSKLELFLADLGINGRIYRLNVLKNLAEIINEERERGTKNIIAVGNDQTVSRVVDFMLDKNLALGLIPMGENNLLAQTLGINSAEEACKIISARLMEELDVGKINEQYFLISLEIEDHGVIFNFKDYNVNPLANNSRVGIYNINMGREDYAWRFDDGVMEALFVPEKKSWWRIFGQDKNQPEEQKISIFPIKNMEIGHKKKPINIVVDGHKTIKTPAKVEVLKRKLKIIVGKRMAGG